MSPLHCTDPQKSKGKDGTFLGRVASSGTLGDKLAAMVVQLQQSPIHHSSLLDGLLKSLSKNTMRESLLALGMLNLVCHKSF